jgi:hypothetical protein
MVTSEVVEPQEFETVQRNVLIPGPMFETAVVGSLLFTKDPPPVTAVQVPVPMAGAFPARIVFGLQMV